MTKAEAEALCAKMEAEGQRAAVVSMAELTLLQELTAKVDAGLCSLREFARHAIALGVMRPEEAKRCTEVQLIPYEGESIAWALVEKPPRNKGNYDA
jgi:hypothetical protein